MISSDGKMKYIRPKLSRFFMMNQTHISTSASQDTAIFPASDIATARFRGLEAPDAPEDGKFVYTNCTGKPYDDNIKVVSSVTFDISRFGKHQRVYRFRPLVTVAHAIRAAEKYLSQQMTEDYFDEIKDDIFNRESKWTDYVCRGDALTDAKFLEKLGLDNGALSFYIGS